ncbi:hypothetical protein CIP107571_00076 [Corynebacterium diphtheriae]|nr:hypothetical protein CIP107571_00076 [Corynebacterium diphtheriae]
MLHGGSVGKKFIAIAMNTADEEDFSWHTQPPILTPAKL